MTLTAHFENGTPGAEILTTDIGSADPFDASGATLSTLTYDKTHARGLLAAKFTTLSSGNQTANLYWRASFGTQVEVYDRLYAYFTGYPPDNSCFMASLVSSATSNQVRLSSDGKIRISDNSNTIRATSASAIPLDQWIRFERHIVSDASSGSYELRVYTSDPEADIGDYDYALTTSGVNTGATQNGFQFGWCISHLNQPSMWIDAVECKATDWLGPSLSEPTRDVITFTGFTTSALGDATTATIHDFKDLLVESADRLTFVSTPSSPYLNSLALQVTLEQDDYQHDGESERTMFTNPSISYPPGQDLWIALALRLDPSFPSVTSPLWQLVLQMFGLTDGITSGSPPLALEINNDYWSLTVRGGVKADAFATAPKESFTHIAPVEKDVWAEFLIHSILDTGSDGLTEAYYRRRGDAFPATPQVTDNGVNVLTVTGVELWAYPSVGLYRKTRVETGLAYYGVFGIRGTRDAAEALFPAHHTTGQILRANHGPTGDRPDPETAGSQYFDTDLAQPVWWNGSEWVDATGVSA